MGEDNKYQNDMLFTRLGFAHADIVFSRKCATYLLKKKWRHGQSHRKESVYFQQSVYTTAFVVSYARPFTNCYGFPKSCSSSFIKYCVLEEGDSAGRVLHDYFIQLRDKIYAHTDSTHHALRLTSHVYDDDVTIGDIETIPDLCVTADKLTSFNEMTENMIHNLSERLKQLKETAPIIRHDETWT